MLRASSDFKEQEVDLSAVTEGGDVDSGVEGGAELTAFAEAVVVRDDEAIAVAREQLIAVLGKEATVDAASVIGEFERMVRVADGTGIPLDEELAMMTKDFRDELGIDQFDTH